MQSAEFMEWYKGQESTSVEWFQTLHRFPETAFEEHQTAHFVASRLREFGIEVHEDIGKTGVVGVLEGSRPGPSVGFRAELDALEMDGRAPGDIPSETPGKFHGCGHDGHSVTLLTFAAFLASHRDFPGRAVFIFQPAEETLGGAVAMLEDGLFDRFPVDQIYALHNIPGIERGTVAICKGGALASSDVLRVTITADGTHGSAPQTGQDAIMASAVFLTGLQQSITRVIDCRENVVVSFGKIEGGRVNNILPGEVTIEGSLRSHSADARQIALDQIARVAKSVELTYGVKIDLDCQLLVPVTLNDGVCAERVARAAGKVIGEDKVFRGVTPPMAAEDFSYFAEKVPATYFFVGQDGPYCHHPEFRFDPQIFAIGASIYAEILFNQGTNELTG
ncbi:hippurate hydrolase [Sulfitobacter undariae]|uniref:Hippurate hydrolase n=1 Tax=Sulfitobacter undariae TaxID=1563671 RepID=A0A7W6E904_9RHOB|nr:amidohydrolase [Sulfitobacter undariae]MBB3995666.1 hippurate hydrolase [Sulfitobacter undariae]